ncbi:MAG: C4-type zinc ribbon domain-containing protein [Nibricoccus sp.]
MRHPALEKILILQDRDGKRLTLEAQLKAVPRDIASVEQKIAVEKTAIESARTEMKELEVKKKALETDIRAAEEKLGKYRTQQLSVRKNDEFQALGHEIETTQAAISVLEENELGVMYAIDEAKKKFNAAEATLKQNIAGHEARIRDLKTREASLAAELKDAQAAVVAAREPIDVPSVRIYDRIAARGLPACVPIRDGKCGGCHLKVSSEAESESRKGDKLATCDQCGRIVYFDF